MQVISDEAQLRERYRQPSERARDKVRDRIDEASARFIARSPFLVLATADALGRCDVSPRGGPPGFVAVLDERHVAVPDLGGNNRLDSATNLLANPYASLLFIVPGKDETLRVAGPAVLSDDPEVLDRTHLELRRPKMALVVETAELFGHCAKAFRRSRLWDPSLPEELADAPDLAEIYACQNERVDADAYRRELAEVYEQALRSERAD